MWLPYLWLPRWLLWIPACNRMTVGGSHYPLATGHSPPLVGDGD